MIVKPAQRAGFTIIELMAVILLIALLISILFGAAQYVVRTARFQRATSTAAALQAAIATYRHEYGLWPIPDDPTLQAQLATLSSSPPATNAYAQWTLTKTSDGISVTFPTVNNYLVFDMLRASSGSAQNPYNTNNVQFIDNSTVFTTTNAPLFIPRYRISSSGGMIEAGHPIVYQNRDGTMGYYSITIWFDMEKVEVDL